MAIHLKPTEDTHDENSSEVAVHKQVPDDSTSAMSVNKHRVALIAGVCGLVVLAGVVTTIGVMVSKSFSSSPSETNDFDFPDTGPDFSGVTKTPNVTNTTAPTLPPTNRPTAQPTAAPTGAPTLPQITASPTKLPTNQPSYGPTFGPSTLPSVAPSVSFGPTLTASSAPSSNPTVPTPEPTLMPNTPSPVTPINFTSPTLLTFCVIADVPYYESEALVLPDQILTQMDGCEFLVHLGDIMKGETGCAEEYYTDIRDTLLESTVPTFMIVGDNEWNDCGDNAAVEVGWGRWMDHLMHFENNWNHTLSVVRNFDYPEAFYFIEKRTLIFGLNIVGGRVVSRDEWMLRHSVQFDWVKAVIEMNIPMYADGVIIMAHAEPTDDHVHFFEPLKSFIKNDLQGQVPILYLHGDGHDWMYTPNFYNQRNFLRIQHEGGVRDPILKILADPHHLGSEVYDAFQYDRQLHFEQKL